MSARPSGLKIVLVAAVLFGAYKIYRVSTAPLPIAKAIREEKVQTQVFASGGEGKSVSMTVTRPSNVIGTVTITIPSGTVLYAASADGQRLITAVNVTVTLSDETPSVTQQIPTYCIDEFARIPLDQDVLRLVPTGSSAPATTEETEPLHQLADCMRRLSDSEEIKQLAVWSVHDDWLHKTREEAIKFVAEGLAKGMRKDRRDQLDAKEAAAARRHPLLSDGQIREAIDKEYDASLPEIERVAANKAEAQVTRFINGGGSLLSACGYSPGPLPLFQ